MCTGGNGARSPRCLSVLQQKLCHGAYWLHAVTDPSLPHTATSADGTFTPLSTAFAGARVSPSVPHAGRDSKTVAQGIFRGESFA